MEHKSRQETKGILASTSGSSINPARTASKCCLEFFLIQLALQAQLSETERLSTGPRACFIRWLFLCFLTFPRKICSARNLEKTHPASSPLQSSYNSRSGGLLHRPSRPRTTACSQSLQFGPARQLRSQGINHKN